MYFYLGEKFWIENLQDVWLNIEWILNTILMFFNFYIISFKEFRFYKVKRQRYLKKLLSVNNFELFKI